MHLKHPSIIQCLRGGRGATAASWGVALGIVAGFLTGWNLSFVALVYLGVVLNVSTRWFLSGWIAAAVLAWLCLPATFYLGMFALDYTPLGRALLSATSPATVALFAWDCYTVVGGALLGSMVGVGCALALRPLIAAVGTGQAGQVVANSRKHGQPFVRPLAVVPVALLSVALIGAYFLWAPKFLCKGLLQQLAALNRADVSARQIRISPWDGRLEMEGLRFADPQSLGHDRLRIHQVSARIDVTALISGRLVLDKVLVRGLSSNIARGNRAAGRGLPHATVAPPSWEQVMPAFGTRAPKNDLLPADWVRNWPAAQRRIGCIERAVAMVQEIAPSTIEKPRPAGGPRMPLDYLARPTLRSDLGRCGPRFAIARLKAEDLDPSWGAGASAHILVSHLRADSGQVKPATTLSLIAPELRTQLRIDFGLAKQVERHRLQIWVDEAPVDELVDLAKRRLEIDSPAEITLVASGYVDRNGVELRLDAHVTQLAARFQGDAPIGGLPCDAWNEALQNLSSVRCRATLAGHWSELRLSLEPSELMARLTNQLRTEGREEVALSVERKLAPNPPAASRGARGRPTFSSLDNPHNDSPQTARAVSPWRDMTGSEASGDAPPARSRRPEPARPPIMISPPPVDYFDAPEQPAPPPVRRPLPTPPPPGPIGMSIGYELPGSGSTELARTAKSPKKRDSKTTPKRQSSPARQTVTTQQTPLDEEPAPQQLNWPWQWIGGLFSPSAPTRPADDPFVAGGANVSLARQPQREALPAVRPAVSGPSFMSGEDTPAGDSGRTILR